MIGHHARLRENDHQFTSLASIATMKSPPFFNVRALITREINYAQKDAHRDLAPLGIE